MAKHIHKKPAQPGSTQVQKIDRKLIKPAAAPTISESKDKSHQPPKGVDQDLNSL